MLCLALALSMVGCAAITTENGPSVAEGADGAYFDDNGNPNTSTVYPAAIMAEGEIYLKSATAMPAEIDESAIIGYTSSYTDTYPEKDGETNFNRELGMPYAKVDGGVAVLYENEWHLCTPKDKDAGSGEGVISFYGEPTREGTNPVAINASTISAMWATGETSWQSRQVTFIPSA